MKRRFQDAFARRTRDEWSAEFEGTDTCVAPVLSPREAPHHPQNRARQNFVEVAGIMQPAPAPRYSRTPTEPPGVPPKPGEHTCEALVDWGIAPDRVADLVASGVIATSK
jgi:alpha-methylacyl-CoA racemase